MSSSALEAILAGVDTRVEAEVDALLEVASAASGERREELWSAVVQATIAGLLEHLKKGDDEILRRPLDHLVLRWAAKSTGGRSYDALERRFVGKAHCLLDLDLALGRLVMNRHLSHMLGTFKVIRPNVWKVRAAIVPGDVQPDDEPPDATAPEAPAEPPPEGPPKAPRGWGKKGRKALAPPPDL